MSQPNCLSHGGSRYYRDGHIWRPSVTSIVSMVAKGEGFTTWLIQNANRAEQIRREAATRGTALHRACEGLLAGRRVSTRGIDPKDVRALRHFVRLCEQAKLEPLATEHVVVSAEPAPLGYAGTFDVRVRFGATIDTRNGQVIEQGEIVIVDLKSGSGPYAEQEMQVSAYCYASGTPAGALLFLRERGLCLHRVDVEKWWWGFQACHELFCLLHPEQPVVTPPLPAFVEPPNMTEIIITEATTPQGEYCKQP